MGSAYRELFKLYDLIQNGDTRSVEQFLLGNKGLNVNEVIPCKNIGVLHLAVGIEPEDKSRDCTELLLKHGGDPNLCNDDGVTPVHIAAIWGRAENLKLLIGCGGDPSRKDIDGHSSFDYAAREQQWNAYDYLHDVVDQLDDSIESHCEYTLDLDKVLVTTDQMVAEYEPVNIKLCSTTQCRKSEMVKEWCEKTSSVINKIYPTILGDTFLIEDEFPPWKSSNITVNTDITQDKSLENQSNITNTTFRTCLPEHPVELSGIKPLEITSDESKNSCSCNNSIKQRMSVYENFSLPGSPNSITHANYNTKTSLKKCKHTKVSTLSSDIQRRFVLDDTQSLLTEDYSIQVDLDKALAVVQNKTNEFICSNSSDCFEDKAGNTRRSSASSGVSSTTSGSIVIANVQEEYRYEDVKENVVLIEKRLLVSPVVLPIDESADSVDQTVLSVASSLPTSVKYDNKTLRAELLKLGFQPGPVRDDTRTLYLKKLKELKKNPIVVNRQGKTYSIELEKSLRSADWMSQLSTYNELENKARTVFANPSKKWREGTTKTSFTYLLLDPRITDNLPGKAGKHSQHDMWKTFVSSIFYVGKGKRSRPYSHLYQALTLWRRDFTTSKDKKVQHILDIWSNKVGVICLHIFQNVIPAEAYTYEAAMIDAIGLQNLKNLKCGNYYGSVASWPLKDRRMLGLYLLYKAMLIFLSEGERQLRPDDID